MKKSLLVVVGAIAATTLLSPSAFARHKMAKMAPAMAAPANPRMDKDGQFYAAPMQAGPGMMGPGMGIPGLGLATGVAAGVAQPLIAAPAGIVSGVTAPLVPPS